MSLFLPSNLSPNFQEVIQNVNSIDDILTTASIDFQFQVNSNGSCVRSYKLEILNGRNDADVPDDNILATFYGVFDKPLYNKDIYTITLFGNEIIKSGLTLEVPKDYRWRLRLYEDKIYDEDNKINIETVYGNTYVGAGHIVGTTKNVIWLNKIDNNIVEDKYVQTVLYSHDNTNDFNPFNEKIIKSKEDELSLLEENQRGIRINSSYENLGILNGLQLKTNSRGDQIVTGIVIDINEILPEYRKKITDGNMYLQLRYEYGNPSKVPSYDTNQLPKLITGITNLYTDGYTPVYVLEIDQQQGYIYHDLAELGWMDYRYSLVYIQRQQIYSVDKSVGTHQLNKVTLDESLDYNTFHNTNIETGLVSDNFDYGRVYIDPVKEFDNKLVPNAYINIAYTQDQLINTTNSQKYNLLTSQPDDWTTNCEKYYYADYNSGVGIYKQVSKQYVKLDSKPNDWEDNGYKQYYEQAIEYQLIKKGDRAPVWPEDHYVPYFIRNDDGTYVNLSGHQQPENWETEYYLKYYIEIYRYYSLKDYTVAPGYVDGKYFTYGSPKFNSSVSYYSYGIPQTFLSTYTNSLSCIQLTNYVEKTGECALFSDLKFKPDRFYMYQIFIPDTAAPNYDASKNDNPYKFYTGVKLSEISNDIEQYVYLGGQKIDCVWKDADFIIDTNNDGVVNNNDAVYLMYHTYSPETRPLSYNKRLYDYNNDGEINNADVVMLQDFYNQVVQFNPDLSKSELQNDFKIWLSNSLQSYITWPKLPVFDFENKTNLLPIYSNHQIGDTNQYMCFIQPNLGIFEDKYKPCMLQLYNNKYQYELYITNYNRNNMYNKDYSIDKLDDSQWLVVLTYPTDMSNIEPHEQTQRMLEIDSLIYKPQTKYKIYTNFVNSIPEGYFYYRSNKILEFEYYDFYTNSILNNFSEHEGNKIIPCRDVIVKCKIYDDTDTKGLKNLVPIKYYKYTIGEVDKNDITKINNIVYQGDCIYDGKYQYIIKGLENCYQLKNDNTLDQKMKERPMLYRIQITAEDEYNRIYEYSEDVFFGYIQEVVSDRISAQIDYQKYAAHIQFAPIKTFIGCGNIKTHLDNENLDNNYVEIQGKNGLLYNSLQDNARNSISFKKGEDFKFITKLRINKNMLFTIDENGHDIYTEDECDVLCITTDEDDKGSADSYRVTFDTRTIIRDQEKYTINTGYLSFRLYQNDQLLGTVSINDIGYTDTDIIKPNNFEYAFTSLEENTKGIYFIEENSTNQSTDRLNTNNDNNVVTVDNNGLKIYNIPKSQENQIYYIYDNTGLDINEQNIKNMNFLFITIKVDGNDVSFTVQKELEQE